MDEPLTDAEIATLVAHGYEAIGTTIDEHGMDIHFEKDGRVEVYSRAVWRALIAELTAPPTEDVKAFGKNAWVYCSEHKKPHKTGWCTIHPRDKIGLGVATADEAYEKCRQWGFPLYRGN